MRSPPRKQMKKNLNPERAKSSRKELMLKQFAALTRRYEKLIDEFEALPPEIQKGLEALKRTSVAHLSEAGRYEKNFDAR
jgi:hypothetical protein